MAYMIDNVGLIIFSFFKDGWYLIFILICVVYGNIYGFLTRRSASRMSSSFRETEYRDFAIFRDRLSKFDPFAILFVVALISTITLPFVAIALSRYR